MRYAYADGTRSGGREVRANAKNPELRRRNRPQLLQGITECEFVQGNATSDLYQQTEPPSESTGFHAPQASWKKSNWLGLHEF